MGLDHRIAQPAGPAQTLRSPRSPARAENRSIGTCRPTWGDRPGPAAAPDDQARARELVGSYQNDAMTLTIGTDGQGCGSRSRCNAVALGSTGGSGQDHHGLAWRLGRLRPVAMEVALEWEVAHLALDHPRRGAQPAWGSRCRSASAAACRVALASRRGGKRGLAGHLAPRDVQAAGKRQPIRVDLGVQGGLVHEGADGVVDQQVRPDLLADPVGIAAA